MSLKQFIRRQIMGSSTFRRIEAIEQRLDESERQIYPQIQVMGRNFAPYCYLGRGVGLIRLCDGHVLYVIANEVPVAGELIKTGNWFPHVENLLRQLVRPNQTVVNAGAHMGYFSVLLADLVGSIGRLLAIEPQPYLADLIDRSLYLNGYRDRSEVICCALGPQEGSVDFAVREAWTSGGMVVAKADMVGSEWITRPVRQRRLDDIVKERGMKPVDLILIDTEGYEPLVLDGCPEILATPSIRIIMEWSPQLMSKYTSVNDFVARLHDQGFRVWEICGTGEPLERSASELFSIPHCDVLLSRHTIEEFGVAPA